MTTVCETRGLVKRYKEVTALDGFDMEVKEGEILGLLGPNGSGKTTAINCLLGLLTFDTGTVSVFGQTPGQYDRQLKSRIGLVPGDLAYFEELTVLDNIRYFAGLYQPDRKLAIKMANQAIEFTGLEKYRKLAAKKLSGGLKRRLNIACGMVHQPDFLVLDEPTLALDAQSRKYVLDGVRQMNCRGTTVLYTTHYLEEAEELCDRIVIIDQGRNLATGTLTELMGLIEATESVHIQLVDREKEGQLLEMAATMEGVTKVTHGNGQVIISLAAPGHHLAGLIDALRQHRIAYSTLYSELPTLNDLFLSLTGKGLRE
jgi:ABC-2 type transport system ATP-binding protein